MEQSINWRSTKFMQAVFIQVTGAVALFLDKIDGGTYVALSTLALSIYSLADVVQKRVEWGKPGNDA
jgi:hypothetical protein